MNPDVVNGIYEASASLFLLLNVIKLYKDKKVRGVSWVSTLFFTSWGYWNLYFYNAVHLPLSFYGGLFVVSINTTWLLMMWNYIRKEKWKESITVENGAKIITRKELNEDLDKWLDEPKKKLSDEDRDKVFNKFLKDQRVNSNKSVYIELPK